MKLEWQFVKSVMVLLLVFWSLLLASSISSFQHNNKGNYLIEWNNADTVNNLPIVDLFESSDSLEDKYLIKQTIRFKQAVFCKENTLLYSPTIDYSVSHSNVFVHTLLDLPPPLFL